MDSKEIRELIDLISRSNFTTFELERNGFRLKLVKGESGELSPMPEPPAARPAQSEVVPAPPEPAEQSGLYEFHSPIVGTFFSAPGPDAPPFVEEGSRVDKGQVLCIVEAMKVMNEIESENDAEVVEILVSNGQPVEYGEPLFRLRALS